MPGKPGSHLPRRSWTSERSCSTPMRSVLGACCMACQKLARNTHAKVLDELHVGCAAAADVGAFLCNYKASR